MTPNSMADSTLLCQEDPSSLEDSSYYFPHQPPQDEDDYIENLLSKERTYIKIISPVLQNRAWLDSARSEVVKWIAKKREHLGLSYHTAYLAVAYLDRFFLKKTVENRQIWAVKLLSVACLTIAAKLEECHVPALSDFEVDEYHFDDKSIQRMELIILTTLEWRMRLVTPIQYFRYLASKIGGNLPAIELSKEAAVVIFSAIESMNSAEYMPSVLALSAFSAASGHRLTEESLESGVGVISANGSLQTENVLTCYNKIYELWRKKRAKIHINDPDEDSELARISSKKRRFALDAYSCHSLICNKDSLD